MKIMVTLLIFMFSLGLIAEDFSKSIFEYSGPSGIIMLAGTEGHISRG